MSKNKDSMTKERWAALKAKPSAAVNYTHVSARAWMEPNKKDHLLPSKPRVERGTTYHRPKPRGS